MAMVEVTLQLPEEVVRQAREDGLLTDEVVTELLRAELRRQAAKWFLELAEKVQQIEPRITEEEIEAEVKAVRAERRAALERASK